MSRIVVVVGGTSGIGKALVQRFASLGDHVFPIGKANCDITDPEQIDRYFKNFNEIDVLINNAAINQSTSAEIYFLAGMLVLAITLAPIATAAALRVRMS